MARSKVHITLQPDVAADPARRSSILEQIQLAGGLTEVNQKRFDRYGLLTGLTDDSAIDRIRGIKGVKSVEADQVREPS
ncbi:MAG: hypothetical protein SFV51_01670 [Bryobacteraceae bacterium]|nr:hypothetical protein [Bryobacteraceae bacterium]